MSPQENPPKKPVSRSRKISPTIIAAIIGLIGTILAPIITAIILRVNELEQLERPTEARKGALKGTWKGRQFQEVGIAPHFKPIEYDVYCDIDWDGKQAFGNVTFRFESDTLTMSESFPFTGGFHYERFLKLDYYDNSSGKVQFGTLLLELHENGKRLEGLDAGFGYKSRRMLTARLWLDKISDQ